MTLLLLLLLPTQVPTSHGHPSAANVSPCPGNWNTLALNQKKKSGKQTDEPADSAAGCVELPLSSLELQEFLQSFACKAHLENSGGARDGRQLDLFSFA